MFDFDWAEEMANVALQKYKDCTGNDYTEQTGIPFEKVAFEIRIHAILYLIDFKTKNTDVTDASPGSGGFQYIIDALYEMRWR